MTPNRDFKIEWIDREREPRVPPNPAFPEGVDVDVSNGKFPTCWSVLPYPARRVGAYYVECTVCGVNALITTAGRVDDPRSIKMACDAARK